MSSPAVLAPRNASEQREAIAFSAVPALMVAVALVVAGVLLFALVRTGAAGVGGVALIALGCGVAAGLVVVQPNESRVLILFGRYAGTITTAGWWWVNPFTILSRETISLRVRNFETGTIKVNDAVGSPIEIATVVAWRVNDTAKAVFDVEEFRQYVVVQSETAVRHLASQYPYDDFEEGAPSLRANADEVSGTLHEELQARLDAAGVEVLETRLTHLAYASEIAEAMLRRQQASAIVAARRTIVEGAVGLVDMALSQLGERGAVELDGHARSAMAANLMLVLSGDRGPVPVITTGSSLG
jgi:regulator of protease activity HflC (stomatin/prohibitin superfamily)